jgi:hypothetical protein
MHHMTANWVPIALRERNQRCFGVWGTVGSTGRWEVLVGAFSVIGCNDSECVTIWAFPEWKTWTRFESAQQSEPQRSWRATLNQLDAEWRRTLMVDAPLSPLRIGRQPEASDRCSGDSGTSSFD